MTSETKDMIAPAGSGQRKPPVRVRLRRLSAVQAEPHPPDGENKVWWERLKKALGTSSSHFVNASLLQLQMACRTPYAGISETAVNAALAMIEAAAPRDEIEGALAIQMGDGGAGSLRRWWWRRAAGRGARIGCSAAIEGLCNAGGGSPPPTPWRRAVRPR